MEFNYEDILDRYTTHSNWVDGENVAVTKEEEAYLEQTVTDKFHKREQLSSQEIGYVFNYELFPWEMGEILEEGRHGWVLYEYIFDVGNDEHYMMTFWHHDDYGVGDYEAQEPIRCYLKEVKVMKWVCEGEDK